MNFIAVQHTDELEDFIKNRSRHTIAFDFNTLSEIHEIIKWCHENFQGDAAVKIMNRLPESKANIRISWYMVDKMDFIAFKLRWA